MAKFTKMDHAQNVETLCQWLDILSDRSLDNKTYNDHENKTPKDLVLIWDTGESFGLTPFRNDLIDYAEADIPVKDVTNINRVIGIGTTIHKFQNNQGKDVFLTFFSYHLPTTDVSLFYPQTYHQINGRHSRLIGDSVEIYCKGNIIVMTIRCVQANLPIFYNSFVSTQ